MFKKRKKVIYPRHGAGQIIDEYKEEIDDGQEKYYKIKFFNSPVTISVPVKKAEEMGLRLPLSKYKLRKELKKLGKKVKIDDSIMKNLDDISKEKLLSGKLEDGIELINLFNSLAKKKEKENKNFSYSASQRLETAVNFLKSEIELVLGKNAVSRYNLLA